MMATKHPETKEERALRAELWDASCAPWPRMQDAADQIGYQRTTVQEWGPEGANAGAGPWALLIPFLRRTVRRFPASAAAIVETFARMLDLRGRWVAEGQAVGEFASESDDVLDALVGLKRLVRENAPRAQVLAAARELVKQAEECAGAAEAK